MENKIRPIAVLACIAMVAALLSFFAPFVSVGSWHTYSTTGYKLLEDDHGWLTLAFYGTIVGVILSIFCFKGGFFLPMLTSIGCAGCVLIYFSEAMDYVTNGFWMFIISHAVSAVLYGCAMLDSSNHQANPVTQTPAPAGESQFCTECGTRLAPGNKFCPRCGAAHMLSSANSGSKTSANTSPPPGGWTCGCGRVNAEHVSTCCCGARKSDIIFLVEK